MSNVRWRVNHQAVRDLMKTDRVAQKVRDETQRIADAAGSESEVRTDFQGDQWTRPRGAVIAGYERGATAEHTREVLLRALGGE